MQKNTVGIEECEGDAAIQYPQIRDGGINAPEAEPLIRQTYRKEFEL